MTQTPPTISALSRLFELAARALHSSGFSGGLYPAQWTALRYLAHAAPADRTAARLVRFQQMAMGPVTRTVRTLVAKGLVVEAGMAGHHRSKQLELTAAGIALLAGDPLLAVDAVLASATPQETRALAAVLARIISTLQTGPDDADGPGLDLDGDA